jgi:hypothetical protein
MKARIRGSAEQIRDPLQRAWQKVECQLDMCSITNGAHVETH